MQRFWPKAAALLAKSGSTFRHFPYICPAKTPPRGTKQATPMISILIPTYCYDCTALASALSRQGTELQRETGGGFCFELIVGDDGSPDAASVERNRAVNRLPGCRLWESPRNLGRAAIRNRLAEMAAYPWLLFIDSDAGAEENPGFLRRYWQEAAAGAPVVCGGLRNVGRLPRPGLELRFRYEAWLDRRRSAGQRSRSPYGEFTAFNFLIRRSTFLALRFNEQCRDYGYEDVDFGLRLKAAGADIKHIENPLIHLGLDENACFLGKIETSLRTLHSLGDRRLEQGSAVARMALRLKRLHLDGAMRLFHAAFRSLERRNLLGSRPSIAVLSLYKLGYYCSLRGTLPGKGQG